MSTFAVVPVKHLDRAKSRLEGAVADRPALALSLLEGVLEALRESRSVDRILVVSPDPRVRQACPLEAFLLETGQGLNPALEEARRVAVAEGATDLLVVLADLATLTSQGVRRFLAAVPPGPVAVAAPDRHDQGTNALFLRPPELLPYRFGQDSLKLHQEEAARQGLPLVLFRDPETMTDLDTPEHLKELFPP